MNMGTLSPCPWDLTLSGQNGHGGTADPPRHSGPWVGAPVASLRGRTLRPGAVSITPAPPGGEKNLPEPSPARYNIMCSGSASYGRF